MAPRRLRVELVDLAELFVERRLVLLLLFLLGILLKAMKFEGGASLLPGRTMIVKTLQGIPFLCDPVTKTIYAYEKVPTQPLIPLGTYNPETETFTLSANWKELYETKLTAYRASLQPRSRLPQTQVPTTPK